MLRDAFLFVHPVNPEKPDAILNEENYRRFNRLKQQVTEQIS